MYFVHISFASMLEGSTGTVRSSGAGAHPSYIAQSTDVKRKRAFARAPSRDSSAIKEGPWPQVSLWLAVVRRRSRS